MNENLNLVEILKNAKGIGLYSSLCGECEFIVANYEHVLLSFIKELYKEIKLPEKGNLRWKPIEGEKYYYINDIGIIDASYWRNNISDKYRYDIGNCFKYGDGSIRTILKIFGNVFANKKEDD